MHFSQYLGAVGLLLAATPALAGPNAGANNYLAARYADPEPFPGDYYYVRSPRVKRAVDYAAAQHHSDKEYEHRNNPTAAKAHHDAFLAHVKDSHDKHTKSQHANSIAARYIRAPQVKRTVDYAAAQHHSDKEYEHRNNPTAANAHHDAFLAHVKDSPDKHTKSQHANTHHP